MIDAGNVMRVKVMRVKVMRVKEEEYETITYINRDEETQSVVV